MKSSNLINKLDGTVKISSKPIIGFREQSVDIRKKRKKGRNARTSFQVILLASLTITFIVNLILITVLLSTPVEAQACSPKCYVGYYYGGTLQYELYGVKGKIKTIDTSTPQQVSWSFSEWISVALWYNPDMWVQVGYEKDYLHPQLKMYFEKRGEISG